MSHIVNGHLKLRLLVATRNIYTCPLGRMCNLPITIGIEDNIAFTTLVKKVGMHWSADKVLIRRDALKLLPVIGIAIRLNSLGRHYERNIYLLDTVKSRGVKRGRLRS